MKKATKQSRATARRKERQKKAWDGFLKEISRSRVSPEDKDKILSRGFGALTARSKQQLVEKFG